MRTRTLVASALAAALSLSVLAFHAVTPEGGVTVDVSRSGDEVGFAGYANAPTMGESELFGSVTEFGAAPVAAETGADLESASITELEDGSGLQFTWQMGSSLPPQGVPEAVRYNWAFTAGDQTYQLQVKRSNLASVTTAEAPVDHVVEAAEGDYWFQLRGACTANYLVEQNPVQGCYHLGFFDGEVDVDAGTVSMVLPYGATDDIGRTVAETFQPGTPVVNAESASMSITASHQAVISNTLSSQYINGWGTYYPGTVVYAALGTSEEPTSSYTLLDAPGDGSFDGTLTGDGTHLWVRACRGYGFANSPQFPDPCFATSHQID